MFYFLLYTVKFDHFTDVYGAVHVGTLALVH